MSITWTQALVGGFALASAVAAATWAIRLDHISDLESRLEAAEEANSLGYPWLINKINSATISLDSRLKKLQSIDDLMSEIASLKEKDKALRQQLSQEQAQYQEELQSFRQESRSQLENEKKNSVRLIDELHAKVEMVTIPRQSRGLSICEPLKAAVGVASRPLYWRHLKVAIQRNSSI